jgi:hypothetical protein
MGIFGLTIEKKKQIKGHSADDEARALSLETRRTNAELKRRKQELELLKLEKKQQIEEMKLEREALRLQEEIDDLRGVDDEDDNDSSDNMEKMVLMQLLGNMNKPQQQPINNNFPQETEPKGIDLDDETINQALDSFPKSTLKKLKGFSDEQLKELIKTRIGPYASEMTLNKIVSKYREKFK